MTPPPQPSTPPLLPEQPPSVPTSGPESRSLAAPPPGILVVEDEGIVALDIEARLKGLGYTVTGVSQSGEEALRLIEASAPDLVLMDIHIQGERDGIDIACEVRARFRLPVVFLTAYSEDSTLQRAKRAEPYGYILKPFEERELKSIIEMALYKHEAEQEILRLNRLYATLSQINQTIVRVKARDELFREICRVAVEFGKFRLAWVGWLDAASGMIEPVAWAGDPIGFLQDRAHPASETAGQPCLCTEVFTEDRTVVVSDLLNDLRVQNKLPLIREAGLRAAAVLPIRLGGRVSGVLAVYTEEPDAFNAQEIGLLEETATDISFALDHQEAEKKRLEAEQAVVESERKFRSIFEGMADGSCLDEVIYDASGKPVDYRILDVNPAYERMIGVSRDQACGRLASEVYGQVPFLDVFARVAETAGPAVFEAWFPFNKRHLRITVSCPGPGRFSTVFSDITEEKLRAEELARLRADLETAQEVAHVGSWVSESGSTRRLTWSAETCRIFGVEQDSFDNRVETFFERVHPDDRDRLIQATEAAWRGEAPYDLEHRVVRPDGAIRWVHEIAQLERDAEGPPLRMVGVVQDITDRRAAEARLRLQGTALQAAANAVMITDHDGNIEWVNEAFTRMTGYTAEEVVGRNPRLLKSGQHDPACYQQLWATILAGETWRGELVNRRQDGRLYFEEATITPLCDRNGKATHFIAIKQDVTKRKEAAARSHTESEFRRSIIESAAEGICVWEPVNEPPGLHFSVWNPRMTELTGYTVDEINRTGWTQAVYRDPEERAHAAQRMQAAVEDDSRGSLEVTFQHRDGTRRAVILSSCRLQSPENTPQVLVLMTDVTEQRRIEQDWLQMEIQARHREKLAALGTLAGSVAHDINNPINGIMNYADIIGEGLPPESPLRDLVEEIHHETRRITDIVKSLLSIARRDTDEFRPAVVQDLVEATLTLMRTLLRRDRIQIKVTLPPDLPRLRCQSGRLQQVLLNLMTNARDALNQKFPGHDPGKQLHVSACTVPRNGRTWVRLAVEDHGTGIRPEVQEHMFEPFFTTKGPDEGTGLGLSISSGIVKEHQGEIHCETKPGEFTRFCVDLPVEDEPSPTRSAK